MRYPVVRIDCADPMDRSEWIPLSKVEKIKINLDGTDYVLASGNWEVCYEGCFNISDYFSEEFAVLHRSRADGRRPRRVGILHIFLYG